MNEYEVRKHVLSSDLKPNEKMVMFAILMKVNWETFEGPVSVSVLVEMTNSTTPTIKRILSQLTKKNWIERTSKYISKEKSTPALTKVKFDNIGIKNDTSIKNDTGIKVDTPPVSNLTVGKEPRSGPDGSSSWPRRYARLGPGCRPGEAGLRSAPGALAKSLSSCNLATAFHE